MDYLIIVLFIAVMIGVGVYSRKKTASVNEFFLGGRDVGPWLSAFAYGTTYFSAVLFIGYAGKIGWGFGLADLWIVAGNVLVGTLLAWLVLARRTRIMTVRLGAMTMPEFLCQRYSSRWLKIVSAVVIFVFLIPYSASVYTGLGYLFNQTFDIDYSTALWMMAVLTGVYLILGGYLAVARNDFIQGIVMIVGVVLMLGFILSRDAVGGFAGGIDKLGDYVSKTGVPLNHPWPGWSVQEWTLTGLLKSPGVALLGLVILTSLGPWGLPQMVHKFYAIKDTRAIRPAVIISTLFALIMTLGAYFTGALSHLFLDKPPILMKAGEQVLGPDGKPKIDFDAIMPIILDKALPGALLTVILLLVLSASMSTLAGLVMISSSAISVDLVKGEIKRDMGRKSQVTLMRVLIAVFIILSVVLAQQKWQIIVTLMSISWGTVAGAFIGPYVWGLYMRKASHAAAWVGMATGLCLSLGLMWKYDWDAAYAPTIGSLAMIASLIVVPIVSLLTPRPADDVVDRAFTGGWGDDQLAAEAPGAAAASAEAE